MENRPKYSLNEKVKFVDVFIDWRTGDVIWHTIREGLILDSYRNGANYEYTVDPQPCGHYGHKRFGVKEIDINPTPGRIDDLAKIADVRTCNGWQSKKPTE